MSEEGEDIWQDLQEDRKLEIAKQTIRISIRLQKMRDWTLWRGQPPPQQKKRWNRVGTIVGALTTLKTFGCTNRGKIMVINLDQVAPYVGTASDKQP